MGAVQAGRVASVAEVDPVKATERPVCEFCGTRIFLDDLPTREHPCCRMARERGEERCSGCVDFRRRMGLGE